MGYIRKAAIKRKIKRDATDHERLRYKKYALFDFLDDINRHLMSEETIDVIKEVFIKKLQTIDPEKDEEEDETKSNHSKSKKSKKSKRSKKSKKSGNSQNKEEGDDPETNIYYGIYNSEISIKRFFEIFKDDIEKKNDLDLRDESIKEPRTVKSEKDSSDDSGSNNEKEPLKNQKNDPNPKNSGNKLTNLQKNFGIHKTHFQTLIRKILFEKFQKMKIWCRQAYSQDNKNIYIHLKIQGEVN